MARAEEEGTLCNHDIDLAMDALIDSRMVAPSSAVARDGMVDLMIQASAGNVAIAAALQVQAAIAECNSAALAGTASYILQAIDSQFRTGAEVAKRAGYTHDTARRHLSNLCKLGLIEKGPNGRRYRRKTL